MIPGKDMVMMNKDNYLDHLDVALPGSSKRVPHNIVHLNCTATAIRSSGFSSQYLH